LTAEHVTGACQSDDGPESGVRDVGKLSELPDDLRDPWHVVRSNEWLDRFADVDGG